MTRVRPRSERAGERRARPSPRITSKLRDLLEHVRDGLARLDRGEIDVFDVDVLIERYDLAARKLRAFCGSRGAGWERAADLLAFMRDNGENARLVERRSGPPTLSLPRRERTRPSRRQRRE